MAQECEEFGLRGSCLDLNGQASTAGVLQDVAMESTDYSCMFCGMAFLTQGELNDHELLCATGDTESLQQFYCPCGMTFTNAKALNFHRSKEDDGCSLDVRGTVCAYCGFYSTNSQFVKYQSPNQSGDVFVCAQCADAFPAQENLTSSELCTPANAKPFKCPICSKTFSRCNNYKIHLKLHESGRRFFCIHCGRWFRSITEHEAHEKICFATLCGVPPAGGKVLRYSCMYCHKMFHHMRDLRIHLRVHTGERPYVCQHCGKGFTQSQALTIHIRTHTDERPYSCRLCNKAFRDSSALRKHEFTKHTFSPCLDDPPQIGLSNSSELQDNFEGSGPSYQFQ